MSGGLQGLPYHMPTPPQLTRWGRALSQVGPPCALLGMSRLEMGQPDLPTEVPTDSTSKAPSHLRCLQFSQRSLLSKPSLVCLLLDSYSNYKAQL